QVERMMDELLDEGIRTVIGSSLVFQTAQRRGMNAVFIYSADSVKRALDQAVQIGLSSREEAIQFGRQEVKVRVLRRGWHPEAGRDLRYSVTVAG
ncbi:MAG TPA: PrpR N-terminal domain-containing protein, partial [Acidobacteriota bacterium]|nr:PrpR N-terminal domain-containing protein [Acidobacteriota bacterium]